MASRTPRYGSTWFMKVPFLSLNEKKLKKSAQKKNILRKKICHVWGWIRTHGHSKIRSLEEDASDPSAMSSGFWKDYIFGIDFTWKSWQKLCKVGARRGKALDENFWLLFVVLCEDFTISSRKCAELNKNDSYDFYKKELLSKSKIGRREKKFLPTWKFFLGFFLLISPMKTI